MELRFAFTKRMKIAIAASLSRQPGLDWWNHRLHYQSDGARYILASYGRDGNPDSLDYWALRETNSLVHICGHVDADQVMSDRGWHRVCGK